MRISDWSSDVCSSDLIGVARLLGLIALYAFGGRGSSIYVQHVRNAREVGLFRYLRVENFIHRNTDGPLNPYSKVYDPHLSSAVRRVGKECVITFRSRLSPFP